MIENSFLSKINLVVLNCYKSYNKDKFVKVKIYEVFK